MLSLPSFSCEFSCASLYLTLSDSHFLCPAFEQLSDTEEVVVRVVLLFVIEYVLYNGIFFFLFYNNKIGEREESSGWTLGESPDHSL